MSDFAFLSELFYFSNRMHNFLANEIVSSRETVQSCCKGEVKYVKLVKTKCDVLHDKEVPGVVLMADT